MIVGPGAPACEVFKTEFELVVVLCCYSAGLLLFFFLFVYAVFRRVKQFVLRT